MFKKDVVPSMFELLEKGQVLSPCVWDCYSIKAAVDVGFEAVLLSGAAVSSALLGIPDLGIMTVDELLYITERISAYSPVPVIVDFDEGYGDSPLNVYRNVERLVKSGAKGLTLDDGMGMRGWQRLGYAANNGGKAYEVYPTEHWLAKVKAALAAIEGTDCMLIARTEARPVYGERGLDECIDRCKRAEDLGAHMTLINRLYNIEECRKVANALSGWKMFPDVESKDGVPEVELEEIDELGFNLVTMHYLEKGSMWGMTDYGRHNFANKSTVYSNDHDMGGLPPEEVRVARAMDPLDTWLDAERAFFED
ncbi:MAG: isocitrate lyase/PEP mutase family protein [Clostridiaceae bacterium]|nr:isocitrate lyase/PEP mutase family protein [Clostridiaceae bacterium]